MKQRYHFTLILIEATRWLEYSSGMIAAQWAGTAQILVEVKIVPDSDIYFISTEGYLYDSKDNIRYIQCYRSACEYNCERGQR